MTHLVDERLIRARLAGFCQTLSQTRDRLMGRGYDIPRQYQDVDIPPPWRRPYGQSCVQRNRDLVARYTRQLPCSAKKYCLRDPFKVPEVWTAILCEKKRWAFDKQRAQGRSKGKISLRRVAPRQSAGPRGRILRSFWGNVASRLPPELIMVIVDNLRTFREVRLLMWAVPEWVPSLPAFY